MNVLFVGSDPTLMEEGASRARMREYAAAIGDLHILTTGPKNYTYEETGLRIYGVAVPKYLRVATLAKRAKQIIEKHQIEVVSAQDPFEHGLAALRATAGTSAKLHVQIHTDFLSPWFVRGGNIRSPHVPVPVLNRIRRRIADRVLPKAHGIRVVSKRISDSIVKKYGSRIAEPSIIPISVTQERPEKVPLPAHPFTFALLTVGRLEPEKRIEDSIAALARIKDAYPAVGLIIVGEGSEKSKLKKLAHALGLGPRVVFTDGWRADAWGLMRSSQAYIQTSAYEGYGRTLVEAALAEVPIITTDVGIVGEVFQGYKDVLAVPVADPAALAVHIRELVENVALRTELAMHARDTVTRHLQGADSSSRAIAADLAKLV
jgi:glycosyltransferase involved in cell wall biosynthesis